MTERTKWAITSAMLAAMLVMAGAMVPKTAPKQVAKQVTKQETKFDLCQVDPASCMAIENMMKDTARAQSGMPEWQRSILRTEERETLRRMYGR